MSDTEVFSREKKMKNKSLILTGILVFGMFCSIRAGKVQKPDVKYDLGEVVVTATRTELHQAEVGSCSTVITAKEIEDRGKMTVVELLRTVPGISVSQNSGLGSFTVLRLRGGEPGYTMVMIDGVEVKYSMEHSGGFFDFAHLTTDNIERIEVIRGPQSTLYGSSAMSGVINIITKKGEGRPKFNVSLEGGSNNTFKETLGLNGDTEKADYSLSVSRIDSDGISIAAEGDEDDGCAITSYSGSFGLKLYSDTVLKLVLRYTDAETDLDDGANDDDPNSTAEKKIFSSKIQFDQALTDWWEHKLFFSFSGSKRVYDDPADDIDITEDIDSWYKGDIKKIDWQHNLFLTDFDELTFGFDYKEGRGETYYRSGTYITEVEREIVSNKGYYIQNQLGLWQRFFTTLGIRTDDHQLFGAETTSRISFSYIIPQTGTRFKGNWGTGFRSPSIYQLYSSYGDPDLKAEKSESYDIGLEQSLFEDRVSFGVSYFHNDFRNLIDYSFASFKYENIGRAETRGVETEFGFKPAEELTVNINGTYLETKDNETGSELLNRPKMQVNLDINWRFLERFNSNLDISYVGESQQITAWPAVGRNDPYTMVNIAASYDFAEYFQIFGKVGNLFNKEYQENYGYNKLGVSFFAGIKAAY